MERQRVISSNIKAIGHDSTTSMLEVEFSDGRVYAYHNVTAEEHTALMEAESIGRHFARNIKARHTGVRRLEEGNSNGEAKH